MEIKDVTAYEVLEERNLEGIHSKGWLLRHKKSKARVLLISNDDENKVFNIGFRTPPADSTGLPHILEHSVLCGSRDFPVKDPFVELVKGSLNTFLNAMTYPDKTVYPVASCNDADFQNLMHVYMDAVFYPNIYQHSEIFRQEGWSYKLEEPDGKLEYNGVVYNEMKGAFSSPEGVLDRVILNSLFPDTCYANESGGDPEDIPSLSYEQFLEFHRTYYHPSNSYIYLYGDMDMAEKLIWLDENYLSHFEELEINSEIKLQKPFKQMLDISRKYSIASNESEKENTYLSYNKVIGTSLDEKLYLAFEILDYALLSAPGAPLKKALIDAGIGKDVMGSYDNGIRQPIFSVIAKNADASQKEEYVQVIENTLKEIVKNGIDQKALAAGINYNEFRFREADFGGYPKGLMYGLQIFDSWLYDDTKPFIHMEALPTFEFLKEQISKGYFEQLIQTWLLDNTHGAIVMIEPEKGRTARMDRELQEKLDAYKAGLSKEEVEKLVADTKELKEYQEAEERQEDLERIPVLAREDISREDVYKRQLSDWKCNHLCALFERGTKAERRIPEDIFEKKETEQKNGVIVHSELLTDYLRREYPGLYLVSSTTKVLTEFEQFRRETDRGEFRYVVPDFRLNKAFDQLKTLSKAQKDKTEFLCNECCWFGCKDRKRCYETVSRKNLGESGLEHLCTAPDANIGYRFSKAMKNPGFISVDDIKNVNTVHGGFAYLLMTEDAMIGALDPNGFCPLSLGKMKNGAYVLASETCALDVVGAELVRNRCV